MTRTRSGWKPSATFSSARKLFISRPAAARSTTDSAISATTSALRMRSATLPPDVRVLLCFSVLLRSTRSACKAGARPKSKLATSEAAEREEQDV